MKYEGHGLIPVEQQAQIITGKVQDATLKKEAALSVKHTYHNILNILKKVCFFPPFIFSIVLDL